MAKKTFTLGEFIDAIEKNGLDQAIGTYFAIDAEEHRSIEFSSPRAKYPKVYSTKSTKVKHIGAACAMGQGFINVGIYPSDIIEGSYPYSMFWSNFSNKVYSMNDQLKLPLKEIATRLREEYSTELNREFTGTTFNYEHLVERKNA